MAQSYTKETVSIGGRRGCLAFVTIYDYGPTYGALIVGEREQVTTGQLREFAKRQYPGYCRFMPHDVGDPDSVAVHAKR